MMNDWSWSYHDYEPEQERLREALCTLGNGYFATRGAAPESRADEVHYPGTYLAGGYDRLKSEVQGRVVENEDLVNLPNWLALRFACEAGTGSISARVEILDLPPDPGPPRRHPGARDPLPGGRPGDPPAQRRLVHMGLSHLAALETELTARNWSGTLEVESALDGR
jgi:alpha,alpha-trehalase